MSSNTVSSVTSKNDFNKLHNSGVVFITKCLVIKHLSSELDAGSSLYLGMCIKKKGL